MSQMTASALSRPSVSQMKASAPSREAESGLTPSVVAAAGEPKSESPL
eukprot:CAMPEP_0172558572 /NCGR_PEP_ID=MMETSP1067-20121228/79759_1 /TAXON_ID=265564 ORGANISM="Thalassiosira punctigera, Strain Tpunct2005C2" /NCGR_SAMPLE_ID=MMETSP1067 /ASSEMBLY_ACC=CAM_ASM_000444 /LENGTH=47 /DNA_ID= /DNA_START= /DNA_END= /DNA_ORIENTATION=